MNLNNIKNIVDKVYPIISKDYKSNAKVEIYTNIFDRLNSIPAILEYESYAEYSWENNKIYLYADNLDNEEDIIRSLIHECVHSNQCYDIYLTTLLKYTHRQHYMAIICSALLTEMCYEAAVTLT